MKRVVYKYPLKRTQNTLQMPKGAKVLTVARQGDNPTLWAMVDPEAAMEDRTFSVVGTGESFDAEHAEYVGTSHEIMGWMVFHVFELRKQ